MSYGVSNLMLIVGFKEGVQLRLGGEPRQQCKQWEAAANTDEASFTCPPPTPHCMAREKPLTGHRHALIYAQGLEIPEITKLGRAGAMAAAEPLSRFEERGKNIVCVGRNYADHVKETRSAVLRQLVLFLKPSAALATEGAPILLPVHIRNLHHELELAVVMGKLGRAVPEAEAMDYVAGYLCLNMTARDVQDECKKKGLTWTLAKSFTGSCPISAFVPKERGPDPHQLKLWLKVNGKLRQEGDTSSMIFSIPYIISYISKIMTVEEGDTILTGTPKGVGPVKENDEIKAGIHGVVSMRFKVERPER
ncbi:LOW QUALITY PROTEIN: acylpyruvase FAHD1, mitochondrial-like [Tupaia chinensis]|uniref:LOW QUALITY PROTEIN: acylpyruvase FAHD1, mitochondrial-like n=1 Tax=Tupaia chinensis TaxID=246437 RepID=UPI000FFBEE0D|nr:LOW QUALITY PROTEIN: acylpyruvase FAHD1, mitochondrial-like [Tupaia chinensis]